MIRIVAYKCSAKTIANIKSTHDISAGDDLLRWLIFSSGTFSPSKLKVVWDLGDFAKTVLRMLPDKVAAELDKPPHRTTYGNYRLFYVKDKVFGASLNNTDADFYDLSQYFLNDPEPETVEGLQEKANRLQTTLEELGVSDPPSLASPLACLRKHDLLKSVEDALPSVFDLPDDTLDLQEVAFQCTPREWISNFKVGHFCRLWKHDISSAFPAEASRLPDLRDCTIEETTDEAILLQAKAGFAIGDFTVFPDHPYAFCSPFMTELSDGTHINFVGTEKNYPCSLDDIRALYEFGMGKFKLKKGWAINWDEPRFPLASVMNTMFSLRGDNPLRSHILKRGMNGVIGKLLETRKDEDEDVVDIGDNYNPLYHAMVTNPVRVKVFRALVEHHVTQDELVQVCVDGFRSTRMLPFPHTATMGGWRCASSEPAFILTPGIIVSHDRTFKGIGYLDLVEDCASRPTAHLVGPNPSTRLDVQKLFLHQNRNYPHFPHTAKDLLLKTYNSTPIRLGGKNGNKS